MKFRLVNAAVALTALSAIVLPAYAHHSFSMFDQQKTVVLEGTVTGFELINPHSWLYVEAADEQGAMVEWTIEMGGPGGMRRAGWEPDTVVSGDPIVVEIHPLKDGTRGGQYLYARLADGRVMEGGDSGIPPNARVSAGER